MASVTLDTFNVLVGDKRIEMTLDEIKKYVEKTNDADPDIYAVRDQLFKQDEEQRIVVSVVMVPELVDSQGDIASAEVIEDAAHSFVINGGHVQVGHIDADVPGLYMVESYIARNGFRIDGVRVKKGSWLMVIKVWNDSVWGKIMSGEFTGFSVGGYADMEIL